MIVALLAALSLAASPPPAAARPAPRKVAVVVGANAAAPGRVPLRFAHEDARSVAAVLRELGGFAQDDVEVLLDPEPTLVLERLDAALARLERERGESMLVFYFSGHSDQSSLFPHGQPLSMEALRARLDDRRATVRVGILDSCRGGSWTGAKGLVAAKPFEIEVPLSLGSEGAVLLASSSGLEDAHESELLHGSFFTHHLVAALRGAADRAGIGEVTLTQAFEYAKALTVRDSALYARATQHPSFEMNLRGRRDLPMTRVSSAGSRVRIEQREGPLRVIQLESGLEVLETAPGERQVIAALYPGRYLVRRVGGQRVFAGEIAVEPGRTTDLREQDLHVVGSLPLARKGDEALPLGARTTLAAGTWELRIAAGRTVDDTLGDPATSRFGVPLSLGVAPSDALFVAILPLGVSYAVLRGPFELLASAYATEFVYRGGTSHAPPLQFEPRLQLLARVGIDASQSLLATVGAGSAVGLGSGTTSAGWRASAGVGYAVTLAGRVTLVPALALTLPTRALRGGTWQVVTGPLIQFGAALVSGTRPVPLVSVHLGERFSIDGYASIAVATLNMGPREEESLALGLTWDF